VFSRGGLRRQRDVIDGRPEAGDPGLPCRTHNRSLGVQRHDRDAFRPAETPFSAGRPGRPSRGPIRPAKGPGLVARAAGDTPGRTGLARLTMAFVLWTGIALSVDGVTLQSFFLTHPVDGITAGSKGTVGPSFCLVLNTFPRPRTRRAACLHRLSTDLCTERLDEVRRSQKTVTTVL
jgi:hypothetical protein